MVISLGEAAAVEEETAQTVMEASLDAKVSMNEEPAPGEGGKLNEGAA